MAELTAEERDAVLTVIEDNLVADGETVEVTALSPAEAATGRSPTRVSPTSEEIGPVLSYDGNTSGKTNVGWEVRGVTTHTFSFYLVGCVTKCMQIRGGATGLYSRSVNCSVL